MVKDKPPEEPSKAKTGESAPMTVQVTTLAIGAALGTGVKVKPTKKTVEYCAAQGETFVPLTDATNQFILAVAPACVVPTNENGKLVIYYQIPDAAHHLFTVPSSVLEYNPV